MAGAAAALLLARAGHDVTVLERVAEPKPVGAGIIVQPTGQAVLARLGLARSSTTIDRLYLRTSGGRTLVDLHYADVDSHWRGLGVHRGVLFAALHDAVTRERGIALHTGATVRSLRELSTFDLVVVADGTVSQLRVDHARRDVAYPWGALWFVTEDRDRVFESVVRSPRIRARARGTSITTSG
jgi:2-polyprenyl-6-methoxyphenol hydroxylase-like FAD-dependent oxidoreductase